VNESASDLFELHKLTTAELRHTATIIWQFAIAIITLQGGAVGLGAHIGLTTAVGRSVLLIGLILSCLFSAMLVCKNEHRKQIKRKYE
jgi:hypothetical protein